MILKLPVELLSRQEGIVKHLLEQDGNALASIVFGSSSAAKAQDSKTKQWRIQQVTSGAIESEAPSAISHKESNSVSNEDENINPSVAPPSSTIPGMDYEEDIERTSTDLNEAIEDYYECQTPDFQGLPIDLMPPTRNKERLIPMKDLIQKCYNSHVPDFQGLPIDLQDAPPTMAQEEPSTQLVVASPKALVPVRLHRRIKKKRLVPRRTMLSDIQNYDLTDEEFDLLLNDMKDPSMVEQEYEIVEEYDLIREYGVAAPSWQEEEDNVDDDDALSYGDSAILEASTVPEDWTTEAGISRVESVDKTIDENPSIPAIMFSESATRHFVLASSISGLTFLKESHLLGTLMTTEVERNAASKERPASDQSGKVKDPAKIEESLTPVETRSPDVVAADPTHFNEVLVSTTTNNNEASTGSKDVVACSQADLDTAKQSELKQQPLLYKKRQENTHGFALPTKHVNPSFALDSNVSSEHTSVHRPKNVPPPPRYGSSMQKRALASNQRELPTHTSDLPPLQQSPPRRKRPPPPPPPATRDNHDEEMLEEEDVQILDQSSLEDFGVEADLDEDSDDEMDEDDWRVLQLSTMIGIWEFEDDVEGETDIEEVGSGDPLLHEDEVSNNSTTVEETNDSTDDEELLQLGESAVVETKRPPPPDSRPSLPQGVAPYHPSGMDSRPRIPSYGLPEFVHAAEGPVRQVSYQVQPSPRPPNQEMPKIPLPQNEYHYGNRPPPPHYGP